MPTNLITIARSGAASARAAIEISAQNIANSGTPDYVRRTLANSELVGSGNIDFDAQSAFSGVRIGGVQRADVDVLQRVVRDGISDLAAAQAEITGLKVGEIALEETRVFETLIDFESALLLLESDPSDPALRTGTVEAARLLTQTFQFAEGSLEDARDLTASEVSAGIDVVNGAASELAQINVALVNAREGSGGRAALLDARDAALKELAGEVGIETTFDLRGIAEVRVAGTPSLLLVSGNMASRFDAGFAASGSAQFEVNGTPLTLEDGAMAGRARALDRLIALSDELDTIAANVITRVNNAQAAGAALDGSPGQPLFSGTGAADIALAFDQGALLALAQSGSLPGSRDTTNLGNLIASIGAETGPVAELDRLLLSHASRIASGEATRDGLAIIAASNQAQLLRQTGVDLDSEAASLIRLQQAFEANSRVIQVASEMFDTILSLN
ncbi:MAG: flagellar hook-associated protein FlgK [Erythrobacter sp.]